MRVGGSDSTERVRSCTSRCELAGVETRGGVCPIPTDTDHVLLRQHCATSARTTFLVNRPSWESVCTREKMQADGRTLALRRCALTLGLVPCHSILGLLLRRRPESERQSHLLGGRNILLFVGGLRAPFFSYPSPVPFSFQHTICTPPHSEPPPPCAAGY